MADWTNQTDSQLDPDAPLTSELAYGWRDNCIAIAEGAVGAPRIQSGAMNMVAGTATGNLVLPLFTVDITTPGLPYGRLICLSGGTVRITSGNVIGTTSVSYSVYINATSLATVPGGSSFNSVLTVVKNDIINFRVSAVTAGASIPNIGLRTTLPMSSIIFAHEPDLAV